MHFINLIKNNFIYKKNLRKILNSWNKIENFTACGTVSGRVVGGMNARKCRVPTHL